MTSEEFKSEDPNCISFKAGAIAEIVEKCGNWWLVNIDGQKGWAPASHLDKTVKKLSEIQPSADAHDIAKPNAVQSQLLRELKTKKQPPAKPPKPSSKPTIPTLDAIINKRFANNVANANNIAEVLKPQVPIENTSNVLKNISTSSTVNENNKNERSSKESLTSQLNQMRSNLKSIPSAKQVNSGSVSSSKSSSVNTTPKIGHNKVLPPRPQLNEDNSGGRYKIVGMTSSTDKFNNGHVNLQSTNTDANTGPKVIIPRPLNNASNAYRVIYDYVGTFEGAIDIKEGEDVDVLEKNDDGWWLVKCNLRQGLVPGSYLDKA